MTDRRIAHLPGHSVAYAWLPGAGTPLLLVHGVGSSLDTWDDLPERLAAAGHSVVAVDLLGHGESGPGNGDYSLGANASAIRDLLDHLGIDRVHIVGHSLGGGVSMQFAYQFPGRIDSLVLISSGGLGEEVSAGLRAATLPGAETVLRTITSPGMLRAIVGGGRALQALGVTSSTLTPRTVAKFERLQDPRRLTGFLATVRSVVGPEGQRVSALDKLGVVDPSRVLVIWGDADPMVPMEHGRHACDLLPGSRFMVVPGAGHHPHNDDPDAVLAALLTHVATVERQLAPALI